MDKNIVGTDKHTVHHEPEVPLAERKARLLRQAEFHRSNILAAKSAVKEGAKPQVIFHNAVDHATFALRNRVDSILAPTGITVAALSPYALTAFHFLRQRRLVRPAIGVALAAAGVAAYVKHRRNQQLMR